MFNFVYYLFFIILRIFTIIFLFIVFKDLQLIFESNLLVSNYIKHNNINNFLCMLFDNNLYLFKIFILVLLCLLFISFFFDIFLYSRYIQFYFISLFIISVSFFYNYTIIFENFYDLILFNDSLDFKKEVLKFNCKNNVEVLNKFDDFYIMHVNLTQLLIELKLQIDYENMLQVQQQLELDRLNYFKRNGVYMDWTIIPDEDKDPEIYNSKWVERAFIVFFLGMGVWYIWSAYWDVPWFYHELNWNFRIRYDLYDVMSDQEIIDYSIEVPDFVGPAIKELFPNFLPKTAAYED